MAAVNGRTTHNDDHRIVLLAVSSPDGPPASRAYWSHAGDEAEEAFWEDELDADDDDDAHDDTAHLCHSCGLDESSGTWWTEWRTSYARSLKPIVLLRRRMRGCLGMGSGGLPRVFGREQARHHGVTVGRGRAQLPATVGSGNGHVEQAMMTIRRAQAKTRLSEQERREVRMAQTSSDRADKRSEKCFKSVS